MRSKRQQPLALAQRLVHEAELEVLEVTQPAVDQPRRRAAGAGADIAALDEQHLDAAERRLARDRRPIDPGADHDQLVVEAQRWPAASLTCAARADQPTSVAPA